MQPGHLGRMRREARLFQKAGLLNRRNLFVIRVGLLLVVPLQPIAGLYPACLPFL